MSAHTPGPWRVADGRICYHAVSDNGAFSTGCISFDGNGLANANLIAAAPDLLAVCKAVLSCETHIDGGGRAYIRVPAHSLIGLGAVIAAVVAKAEGRQ